MRSLKEELRIFVASPSDVKEEREVLSNVIENVNRNIARDLGLTLRLERWEFIPPSFHRGGPQGLIDLSLNIEDCDILIGIFWKRFGTVTKKGGKTGTEHEIHKAYQAWKRKGRPEIKLYFCVKPYNPTSTEELEQHAAVLKFKKNIAEKGLYAEYVDLENFKDSVEAHIVAYLLKIKSVPKDQQQIEHQTKKRKTRAEKLENDSVLSAENHPMMGTAVNAKDLIENRIKFKLHAAEHHLENLRRLKKKKVMMSPFEGRIKWEIEIEDFLFQLVGVRDALLFRINDKMRFNFDKEEVTFINIKNQLNTINKKILLRIIETFEDTSSWFSALNELYQSTHRKLINIHVQVGASEPSVYLITDPQTGLEVFPYLEDSLHKMKALIEEAKNSEPALAM